VLGSNAFSAAHLIDHILDERDYRVIGASRSPEKHPTFLPYRGRDDLDGRFEFHQIDLNEDMDELLALIDERKPEYVVNYAAQSEVAPSWENPHHWFLTNGVAIARLGNHLKDCDFLERYVHISSPEVYGTCEGVVREDAPLNPSTPYAASKAAGDLMLDTLVKNFDFPLVSIRSTNYYGPAQQLFKIIPRSIIYVKLGKTIELHGGGVAVKSYIHAGDVARGVLVAMEQGSGMYHLSPESGIAVRDVVAKICDYMGKDFDEATEVVAERLGQDKAYVIDSSRANEELGWKPQIPLDRGLEQVVDWIERDWDVIKDEELGYVHKP
jgi:dTDP-glucose 4,6-dehydratase